jgi:hypothetical protein
MSDYRERIANLLALSKDAATTEHERQLALAHAMRLMQKHEIKDHEVRAAQNKPQEKPTLEIFTFSGAGGHGVARATAMGTIAQAMGAMWSYVGGTRTHSVDLQVVAHPSTLAHLSQLREAMMPTMEMLGAEACRGMQGYARCVALRSYFQGFGAGVAMHFRDSNGKTPEDDGLDVEGALILQDRSLEVKSVFDVFFPKIVKGRKTAMDADLFYQGRAAGHVYGSPGVSQRQSREVEA